MKWSANNRACTTTWSTLRLLDQISSRRTFDTTGALKMSDLTFFSLLGTKDALQLRADSLSAQLDNVFRQVRGADYESGVDRKKALTGMSGILAQKDKTVADLADVIDDSYLFFGEGEP